MRLFLLSCAILTWSLAVGTAQERDGPALPIILEHADSIVGSGPIESGTREFLGHVRFSQGNVTVECDRAIHNVSANSVDLYTNVNVTQGGLHLKAPLVTYNGNTNIAVASRGVVVRDKGATIQARSASYSTVSHIVVFRDSVVARDSTRLWADTLVYDRDEDTTSARGSVVIIDTAERLVTRSSYAFRNPSEQYLRLRGDAQVWQWSAPTATESSDTLYLSADEIVSMQTGVATIYQARWHVVMTRASVAARCDSLVADRAAGRSELYGTPVVWADSMQLHADTIIAYGEEDALTSVVGRGWAILVAQTDSLRPDRMDQIAGQRVTLSIEHDTLRSLEALGDAQSITFRAGDQRPEGLAKVASDTIRVLFEKGQLTDVVWLGGVEGEHHPEPVVAGREDTYRLPQFRWRMDRPKANALPTAPAFRQLK